MTRRERLEAKVEKRRQWAESRRRESDARHAGVRAILDQIPLGQPILTDHYSAPRMRRMQEKIHNGMTAALEADAMAKHHATKAAGLAAQLDHNIYSDDEDAPDRLRARIDALTAKREAMKASNAAYRKGPAAWAEHLGISAEREAEMRAKIEAGYSWCRQPHPAHSMQNLGANIRRLEKRLVDVEARAARMERAAAAGVLIEGAEYVRVTFPEKPAREALSALREAGFRWSGGSWHGRRANLPASLVTP